MQPRRHWDSAETGDKEFHIPALDHSVVVHSKASGQPREADGSLRDRVDPGYAEYLKLLSERNKLIRKVQRKQENDATAQRERGFNVYVSGANEERIRSNRARARVLSNALAASKASGGSRKKWGSRPLAGASMAKAAVHPESTPSGAESGANNDSATQQEFSGQRRQWEQARLHVPDQGGRLVTIHRPQSAGASTYVSEPGSEMLQQHIELGEDTIVESQHWDESHDYQGDSDEGNMFGTSKSRHRASLSTIADNSCAMAASTCTMDDGRSQDDRMDAQIQSSQPSSSCDEVESEYEDDFEDEDDEGGTFADETESIDGQEDAQTLALEVDVLRQSLKDSSMISTALNAVRQSIAVSEADLKACRSDDEDAKDSSRIHDGETSPDAVPMEATSSPGSSSSNILPQSKIMFSPGAYNPTDAHVSQPRAEEYEVDMNRQTLTTPITQEDESQGQSPSNTSTDRSSPAANLASRIMALSSTKLHVLESLLAKLEQANDHNVASDGPSSSADAQQSSSGRARMETSSVNSESQRSVSLAKKPKRQTSLTQETCRSISITLLSNYGHPSAVGLARISILDCKGAEIPLRPADITIENAHNIGMASAMFRFLYPPRSSPWLQEGRPHWMVQPHASAQTPINEDWNPPPRLTIRLPVPLPVGAVRIWNYGRSTLDSSRGVRKAMVYFNGDDTSGNCLEIQVPKSSGLYSIPCTVMFPRLSLEAESKVKEVVDMKAHQISVHQASAQADSVMNAGLLPDGNIEPQQKTPEQPSKKTASRPLSSDRHKTSMLPKLESNSQFEHTGNSPPPVNLIDNASPQKPSSRSALRQRSPLLPQYVPEPQLSAEEPSRVRSTSSATDASRIIGPGSATLSTQQHGDMDNLDDRLDSLNLLRKSSVFLRTSKPAGVKHPSSSIAESAGSSTEPAMALFKSIPHEPRGRLLSLHVHSNWGSQDYVGIAGIDIYDANGNVVQAVASEMQNCNRLDFDPRGPSQAVDGVNNTCDELHHWATVFQNVSESSNAGCRDGVGLQFDLNDNVTLGLVHIWNYNSSRVSAHCGVKHISLRLDGRPVFQGDIRMASGRVSAKIEDNSEIIAFTDGHGILSLIAARIEQRHVTDNPALAAAADAHDQDPHRPLTPCAELGSIPPFAHSSLLRQSHASSISVSQVRLTVLKAAGMWPANLKEAWMVDADNCRVIQLIDQEQEHQYMNRNQDGSLLPAEMLEQDKVLVWKKGHGENQEYPFMELTLRGASTFAQAAGLELCYDYAQMDVCEDSASQICCIAVELLTGDQLIKTFPYILVHEASIATDWKAYFSFELDSFRRLTAQHRDPSCQDLRPIMQPDLDRCIDIRIVICSTWGDGHYVGLDQVCFVDSVGQEIVPSSGSVFASPASVAGNGGHVNDPRTVDKLFNRSAGCKMWLTPFDGLQQPSIHCSFAGREGDYGHNEADRSPCTLKIKNYSRTATRGARCIDIYCNSKLLCSTSLPMHGSGKQSSEWWTVSLIDGRVQSGDSSITSMVQDIVLTNEGHTLNGKTGRGAQTRVRKAINRPVTSYIEG